MQKAKICMFEVHKTDQIIFKWQLSKLWGEEGQDLTLEQAQWIAHSIEAADIQAMRMESKGEVNSISGTNHQEILDCVLI